MVDYKDPLNRDALDRICLETIRKYSSDTVFFKDKDSKFIWNSAGHNFQLGAKPGECLTGKSDFDFFPKEFAQSARETELMIMATGQPVVDVLEELTLDDDTVRYFLASKYPLYDENGEIIGTWGTSKDITRIKTLEKELEASYSRLQNLARVDDLSGLYNRRYFYEKLDKLISIYSERPDGSTFSVIFIDVDDMNNVNEIYGQPNGDNFLRFIASNMLSNTRNADTCFRTGGDEFAIVLPDIEKLGALDIARKIVEAIASSPVVLEGEVGKITVSAGLVTYEKGMDISELLSLAERKLNKSKRNGKNQVSF